MIRLAVNGDESLWRAVALRLHGATVVSYFETVDSLSKLEDYDAVLFVGPGSPEISCLERFLADGKHVLVASGSWLTLDRLEALSTTANKSNTQFSIVNPDHYRPSRQLTRQHLDDKKLGEPGLVRIHRWEKSPQNALHSERELPAPLVCDIELAAWLMNKVPSLVYATEASRLDTGNRTIQVHLGFSGGAMALIDYSNALPAGDGYQSVSVIGSSGAAYADDHQNLQLLYQGRHPQGVQVDEEVRQRVNLTLEFVDSLQSGRDLTAISTAWSSILAVTRAAEKSLASRLAISLEGHGHD